MSVRIINADVFDGLAQLPDESVHCVVSSPPYWGLRDYGVAGQIGNEPTLGEHLDLMVRVFREVRRVLRVDGTLWLNYGDSYAGSWGAQSRGADDNGTSSLSGGQMYAAPKGSHTGSVKRTPGLKPKDLMLIPSRLAIALCDDGWWVRSAIVWHKPNPMPESCRDRPTSSYENVFLLTKSSRYFYDADAVREDHAEVSLARVGRGRSDTHKWADGGSGNQTLARDITKACHPSGRNLRNVWEIATEPFPGRHFATMPSEVASRCIKAGCPADGTVLDPFGGAGTTALVADRLGRNAILIELNPDYCAMAQRRIENDVPMFADVAPEKLKEPTLFEEVA